MPFFIGEEPTQSNWTETNENALSFILNKPAVIKGEPGNDGEKGQKGEIGPRGIEGQKGEQGVDGSKGQKGEIGVGQKGEVGEKGIDGSKGQKGEEGQSITGDKGEKGMPSTVAGQKGEKGELGEQGDKGIQGQKGIQGEQGIKGQKGEIGNIGITGQKGQKGEQGIIGNTGQKGEKGEIGLTGDKGEKAANSKFINNGSLNSSDEIEIVYDDGTNMTNKIDISSLRELPTMLNTYYGKRLTVVQPAVGSGVEAMWINQDTYSFTESRTTAQLEVQKVEQNTTSPYLNTTTTTTYNFLPTLVNDKVLTVSNGALTWSDFPADDNTRVTAFAIDSSHNLSLSQNDATAPYSVSLAPYLDNKTVISGALNSNRTAIDLVRTSPLANVSINIRPIWLNAGVISGSDILMKYDDYDAVNNPSSSFTIDISPLQNQNKLPTTTTEDQFTVSTTTANNWIISDKLSLNPARFGANTPTTIHSESTLFGVHAGNGTSSANRITAFGYKACEGSGNGSTNTGIGYRALDGCSGVRNVGLGYLAGSGLSGNDNFALGEGSMDGGNNSGTVGIGRYAFRGANSTNSIGIGVNVMGSGFGFHTYATNSVQRSGSNKLLIGNNTSTAAWTTSGSNTGNPYLIDGTMGTNDSVRDLKINANDIYFGSSLPTTNSTATKIWSDQGVLRYGSGSALAYTDTVFSLPSQTGNDDKFLKTDGTNPSWTNKIGSATSHTLFYWNGGTPNHYLLNQATSAGSESGNIVFGHTNGTFYSSISGKVRDSTSGQLRGYIQINAQHGDSSANLDEEILRIGESTNATSDAGEFFGNLKVAGIKYTNNSVQTLPVITPTSSDVGKFLSATSTGAFDWHNKIGSSTAYNWFYWSGGIINSYLLSQPSSAGDQCGAITFGHTNGTMYGSIYGKVRDTTAGQLRGYIQIDTQNNNGTDVLTEETCRLGESTHSTSDAGEFFGNLRLTGVKFSANNNIQTEAVEAPTAADGTASRVLTATGAGTWAWSDPPSSLSLLSAFSSSPTTTQGYQASYINTRLPDATNQIGFLYLNANGTSEYKFPAITQTTTTSNSYGCEYINDFLTTASVGYKNLHFKSSNTTTGQTLGITDSFSGSDRLTAITHDIADSTTKKGKIEFFTFDNTQTHGVVHKAMYLEDAKVYLKHLTSVQSITLDSTSITSNIINRCPANPQIHLETYNTSSGAIVIGNYKYKAPITSTASVAHPPQLSSASQTVSGITYTITSSSNLVVGSIYDRWKAFDKDTLNTGWHTTSVFSTSGGGYTGSQSLNSTNGEWLKVHMTTAKPFGSVKIVGRNGYPSQDIKTWEILASNDDSNWTVLHQANAQQSYNSGNGTTTTFSNTNAYNYYALLVKSIQGPNAQSYGVVHELEFLTVATQVSTDVVDLKATKYSDDYCLLDLQTRQGGTMNTLIRVGKSVASDPQDVVIYGKVQSTDQFTCNQLRIIGTGSGITFHNGLFQQFAVVNPTSSQNGYVLTASATGFDWQLGGASNLLSLSDVGETSYSSQNHRVLSVNSSGNGMEFGGVYGIDDSAKKINIGDGDVSSMGNQSIAIGHEAGVLHANRSKQNSVFIGYQAAKNTAAPQSGSDSQQTDNCVIIGNRACFESNYLENSVVIGAEAALSASHRPHANSVVIGAFAANNQGTDNQASGDSYSSVYIGCNAGRNVHLGHQNVVIGRDCLYQYQKGNTSEVSSDNLMMGNMAGRNMYGSFNAVVGTSCLRYDAGGRGKAEKNACIGYNALSNFTAEVKENISIGHNSMFGSGACQNNISIGYEAGRYSSGNSNIAIGRATSYQQSGSNNIYIGNFIRTSATSNSNELIIGNNNLPNPIILGKMESNVSNSEITFNAKTVNLSRTNMPTSYDSNYPDRIWIDGAGTSTGSNISGVLRIGEVNTQYDSGTGKHNNVLQCANSNSSIFAFTHTSKNRTQNNKHNLTISVNTNLEFVYLFDVKPTHAYYIITVQHEDTQSVNSQTDLNSYITNKSVNGFTVTFRQGDNGTGQDTPQLLADHSISIMGVSANQIDTSSNTIPQLGQTNIFPTGFNLA